MSSGKTRKILTTLLILVVVLLAASGVMWKMGKLPFGPAASAADEVATADGDSTVVDKDKNDKDKVDEEEIVAVPVELAVVGRRSIASYYKAASVIEADRLVDLVTKVQGRIRVLNVEEGDWVEKGQVLAELQNDREKVQLRQAELRLQEQDRQLERTRTMLAEGLISDKEFDDARSAFDLAGTERDLAEIAVEETCIRAPFPGQITERKIVLGQQINATEALFTLADFQPMRVRVYLPEAVARKVKTGQRVLITPEAMEQDLEAVVERVSPVVDPVTSTVRLTLLVDNTTEKMLVGGFVKARITTDSHADALSIPKLALVEEGSMRSVFVAEADSVRKVEINTGLYDERFVEILDGVIDGQFVVVAGQGGLRTGSRIEALNGLEVGWGGKTEDGSSLASEANALLALSEEK